MAFPTSRSISCYAIRPFSIRCGWHIRRERLRRLLQMPILDEFGNEAFFKKMYGDCNAGEVKRNLYYYLAARSWGKPV